MSHLQNILDKARQQFIVEGNPPALDRKNQCMYITESGARCAIGLSFDPQLCKRFNYMGSFGDIVFAWTEEDLKEFPEDINKLIEIKEEVALIFNTSEESEIEAKLDKFQKDLHDLHAHNHWNVDTLKEHYERVAREFKLEMKNEYHI